MSENEIVQVLLFGNKSFSKEMNFRIILHPQFVSLKTVKDLMNHFLLERKFFQIFSQE